MDPNQGCEPGTDAYDVVVVGGGLAGLTAAATAGRRGASACRQIAKWARDRVATGRQLVGVDVAHLIRAARSPGGCQ